MQIHKSIRRYGAKPNLGKKLFLVCFYVLCIYLTSADPQDSINSSNDNSNSENSKKYSLDVPKIAIIGAGIGGTSAAHFLRKKFGASCSITIFEEKEVGGRLATINMAGKEYEVGGSIIHSANKLMTDFLEETGLHKKNTGKLEDEMRFSIVTEEGVVYQEHKSSILNTLMMIWRYGLISLYKLNNYVGNMLDNFASIYPYMDKTDENYFESIYDMLKIMTPASKKTENLEDSMSDELHVSLEDRLMQMGISKILIDELVSVAVRVNYGQMPKDIHAFVGSVGLAGMHGNLWSVEGGNYLVAEKLKQLSNASFIPTRVQSIKLMDQGKYSLEYTKSECKLSSGNVDSSNCPNETAEYDIVLIAAPQTDDKSPIDIKGVGDKTFGLNLTFPGRYHRTVATIVHGDLNPKYVGCNTIECTTEIYFFVDPSHNINSIAKLIPASLDNEVEGKTISDFPNVWKVFSQMPLSKKELNQIFIDIKETNGIEEVYVADWLAYPEYEVGRREAKTDSFRLHRHLYYTNSIEWSASAMEMSVIAAKNIANMVHRDWEGKFSRIISAVTKNILNDDEHDTTVKQQSEL